MSMQFQVFLPFIYQSSSVWLSTIQLPHMSLIVYDAVLAADHAACALLLPLCICVLFACAINGLR